MSLDKLRSLGTYEQINGGAHRKAAPVVGTPSMIRRIGLWDTGCSTASGGKTKKKLQRDERLRRFSKYLKDLKTKIVRERGKTTHFDPDTLFLMTDSKVKIGALAIFRFFWHGISVSVRVELHSEYITITSILNLSVLMNEEYTVKEKLTGNSLEKTPDRLKDIQTRLKDKLELLNVLFTNNDKSDRDIYHEIASVQDRSWKEFQFEIIDGELNGKPILGTRLGEVFADFHGMVSGSTVTSGRCAPVSQSMRPAFIEPLVRDRERKMNHSLPPKDWSYDTLHRLWPLLHSDMALRDYEFTAGAFLGGRVVYVSALGPQPLRQTGRMGMSRQVWPWKPVYYYLQAYTDDEWQIGRLVDRINMLGTLRLASTMEAAGLMKAGPAVNELLKEIKRVSKLIQDEIAKMKFGGMLDSKGSRTRGLRRIDADMAHIQKRLWEVNRLVSHDISYRLERSSYYRRQFQKEATALRETRIEGYQKYQEFVARRLRGIFGYFDLLRQRMEEMDSALAALGRQYNALKMTLVTSEIDALVTAMRNEDREIGKIQEFGEVALIGILMPYYVGMIAFHVFDMEHHSGRLYWLLLIMTLFVGMLVVSRREKDWDDKSWTYVGKTLLRRLLFRPGAGGKPWSKNVSLLFITYALAMWLGFTAVLALGSDASPDGEGVAAENARGSQQSEELDKKSRAPAPARQPAPRTGLAREAAHVARRNETNARGRRTK